MRKVLIERGLKGVTVLDGTAEDVPVENGWADAVLVAQVGIESFPFFASIDLVESHSNLPSMMMRRSLQLMTIANPRKSALPYDLIGNSNLKFRARE